MGSSMSTDATIASDTAQAHGQVVQQQQQHQQPQQQVQQQQQQAPSPILQQQQQQQLPPQKPPPQIAPSQVRQQRQFQSNRVQRASFFGGGRSSIDQLSEAVVNNFNDDDELEASAAPGVIQAEPEPDASVDGPISLKTRIEFSALPKGQTQDVFGLITVQAGSAPVPSHGEEAERQPMDIVAVLDVSGSMGGNKIQQVQDATRFIIDQCDPKDRLGIVAFNHEANRALRLRKMNAEGKNDGNVATSGLFSGGGTSIASGLDMALSVMERRRQRNKVSAILLLTDGQDSSTRSRIPDLMRRAAQANCAIYAFGFGRDHDAALLSEIAEHANTPFTFVEDTDKIREAFAGAVGGLASIVAQQVQLTLKCQVPLKKVHTPFHLEQTEFEATVTIPDMFALERRDVLVELAVPAAGDGANQTTLLQASARYTDLQSSRLVQTAPVAMEAQRIDEPQPEAEPDEEVSAQRERVEVTCALEAATHASDRGQFDEALQVIEECGNRMKSAKKRSSVRDALEQELQDAQNRMQSRSAWEQGGRAELLDAAQMHKTQRCTNMSKASGAFQKSTKSMYFLPAQEKWTSMLPNISSSSSGSKR